MYNKNDFESLKREAQRWEKAVVEWCPTAKRGMLIIYVDRYSNQWQA